LSDLEPRHLGDLIGVHRDLSLCEPADELIAEPGGLRCGRHLLILRWHLRRRLLRCVLLHRQLGLLLDRRCLRELLLAQERLLVAVAFLSRGASLP
jgi:hypothetical protein